MSTNTRDAPVGYERIAIFDPRNKRIADLDPVNHGILPTVSSEISMVHRGMHFTSTYYNDDIDKNDPKYLLVKTSGSRLQTHITAEIFTDESVLIQGFEQPTITAYGDLLPITNNNRNIVNASGTKVYQDPTVTNEGSPFMNLMASQGSPAKPPREFVLKQNREYLIKITADKKNTKVILNAMWYEVEVDE